MEIISIHFLIFIALTIAGYALLSRPAQNFWLLAASYIFYLSWGWQYSIVLAGLTVFNFLLGKRIAKGNGKIFLWVGIGINTLSFLLLKVLIGPYGFSLLEIFKVLGEFHSAMLLPIGFSFYVLQAISYLVDISRSPKLSDHSLGDFALYMAYFPKLLSGPIERPATFLTQISQGRIVNNATIGRGLGLIIIGLLRKMVIADHLRLFQPEGLFFQPAEFASSEKVIGLLLFAFILYNDFAGYSAIVRGISLLFGIELTINFRQPFFANSFSDFWNRWHISLSSWLRDYIFFPLRRSMIKGKLPQSATVLVPPLITMLASGLWHGSYLSMIFWGGLHGFFLVFQEVVLNRFILRARENKFTNPVLIGFIFTFTSLAWVPFGASSLGTAITYYQGLFSSFTAVPLPAFSLFDLSFLVILSLFIDWQEFRTNNTEFFINWKPSTQAWAMAFALLILILFTSSRTDLSGFVYQGF